MSTGDFQDFQREFARYLRDPQGRGRPPGVPARRAGVYRELVFNNLCGFLDACFPVCRKLLGEGRWRRLNRRFQRDWPLHTPWFREIPAEFVRYLQSAPIALPRPRWLADLAHYEWIELAVDIAETTETPAAPLPAEPFDTPLLLAPGLQLLRYDWPVHRIGEAWRPRRPQACCLAVYRGPDAQVRFCELNALTLRLLELLSTDRTINQVLPQLATENGLADPQSLIPHLPALLHELQQQGIVLGVPT